MEARRCGPPARTLPIPEGELQNRASGPSVFGLVTGGDPGWFDAQGGTECGLAGVRICQLGTDTCTDSDAAGQFVLGGLPEGQDIEIAFEKAGQHESDPARPHRKHANQSEGDSHP